MATMAKECLRPAGAAMLVVRSRRGRAREGPTNSSGKFGSFQREVDAAFWGFSRRRQPPRFKQTDIDFSFRTRASQRVPPLAFRRGTPGGSFYGRGTQNCICTRAGAKGAPTRRPRGERKRVLFLYAVLIYT
jgi:hypothetical protein